MFQIEGKYAICDVMIDNVECEVVKQVTELSSAPAAEGTKIVIMPDTHAGKGCVIGFTQKLNISNPRIVPNLIGVDISCTISSYNLGRISGTFAFEDLDRFIRSEIPLGSGNYVKDTTTTLFKKYVDDTTKGNFDEIEKILAEDNPQLKNNCITSQLCSLGSGNHFIEVGVEDDGCVWLTIHCGSRNFGLTVCQTYMKHADEFRLTNGIKTSPELSYLDKSSKYFDRYLKCADACHVFATKNHHMIAEKIISEFFKRKFDSISEQIITNHNYIDYGDMMVRKGAIRSNQDELILIPFNMRDGIAVCKGRGNPDWNFSAPHGSGRLLSRSAAKKALNIDDVKADMKNAGVFTTSLDYALDEAPGAYKDTQTILNCIKDTVDLITLIKPVYNIKGK